MGWEFGRSCEACLIVSHWRIEAAAKGRPLAEDNSFCDTTESTQFIGGSLNPPDIEHGGTASYPQVLVQRAPVGFPD